MDKIIAYTGGEARGNPGPASVGIHIVTNKGEVVQKIKKTIGNSTKNFAEYYGVMLALQTLIEIYGEKTKEIQCEICLSNNLVKKQLNDEAKINEPGLVPMFVEIHNMKVECFPNLAFTQIELESNQEAYRLVNEVLEGK